MLCDESRLVHTCTEEATLNHEDCWRPDELIEGRSTYAGYPNEETVFLSGRVPLSVRTALRQLSVEGRRPAADLLALAVVRYLADVGDHEGATGVLHLNPPRRQRVSDG